MRRFNIASVVVVVFFFVAIGGGCSFFIGDLLDDARVNIAEGEGEGVEGEGEGTEGEGEAAEGEGEIDDNDPACEEDERLLVVRDDRSGSGVDALQVYDLRPGSFRRRFADSNDQNVDLVNDNSDAQNNGFGAASVALGSDDRLYLVGERFVYVLRKSSLLQRDIDGNPMLTIPGFSRYTSAQVLGGHIVLAGSDVVERDEDAPFGTAMTVLKDGDDYGRSVAFTVSGTNFVAVVGAFGYVLFTDTGPAGAPVVGTNIDVEFDGGRFNTYGGGRAARKGIAFDPTTRSLLVGDFGRVVVAKETDGFDALQNDGSGDLLIAGAEQTEVQGIAARGGSAWVLLGRSSNNLLKIDLTTSPPTTIDQATIDTDGFGDSITVGCRRVIVAGFNGIFAVSRDTLDAAGNVGVLDVEEVRLVRRIELGLDGDDGT